MYKNKKILLITLLAFVMNANSNICTPSKTYLNDDEPKIFPHINSLLAPAGLVPTNIGGKKIIIKGSISDKDCKLIPNANVYLWQVGHNGKYNYKPLRKNINEKLFEISKTSTFQGAGSAISDNLGNFNFITIYPQSIDKKEPYINLRVEHATFGTLQTKIYLNDIKPTRNPNENFDLYQIDIVMPVVNTQIRY